MKRAILSRTRYVTAPVLAVALLALAAAPAHAQRREVRNTTHTNLNQNHNTNVNRNTNVNHNTNVNRNTNVNVNRNANVNVNVNNRGGYYGGYYDRGPSVAGVVAASVATAIVVGSIVHSLPPNCTTMVVNGFAYQNCGGTYYQPQYQGSSVTYIVVNHP
jgi:hypothetical protein